MSRTTDDNIDRLWKKACAFGDQTVSTLGSALAMQTPPETVTVTVVFDGREESYVYKLCDSAVAPACIQGPTIRNDGKIYTDGTGYYGFSL
jgi:hypothetical protein